MTIAAFFGVPQLTPITRLWLAGIAVVFVAEGALLLRLWRSRIARQVPAFFCYLATMTAFPASFTARWRLWMEIIVNGWAVLVAVESLARLTRPARDYSWAGLASLRSARKGLLSVAVALVLWAATQSPEPFPEWPKAIYYTRLYTHIGVVSLLAVSLGYSVREKAERRYQLHAGCLLAWMGLLFWTDLQRDPLWPSEIWFWKGIATEGMLAGLFAGWFVIFDQKLKSPSAASDHHRTA